MTERRPCGHSYVMPKTTISLPQDKGTKYASTISNLRLPALALQGISVSCINYFVVRIQTKARKITEKLCMREK